MSFFSSDEENKNEKKRRNEIKTQNEKQKHETETAEISETKNNVTNTNKVSLCGFGYFTSSDNHRQTLFRWFFLISQPVRNGLNAYRGSAFAKHMFMFLYFYFYVEIYWA